MRAHFSIQPVLAISFAILFGISHPTFAAETNSASNRWEREIKAFEASDKTNPPPQHAILFLGSSSIRIWPDLQKDFPGHTVFKRGFGGSELSDSIEFADRIVLPYKPKMIFLYAGDNDLAGGKTPERVFSDFKTFVKKIHAALPQTRIAYISIKPCPARKNLLPEVQSANQLIRNYTKTDDKLLFVDTYSAMLTPNGGLRPELLQKDGLHL
ncbi:MAG TPA: SGNH/GDSL hydrolase family protein, partial [Verrucomicrobiae bacterium]|nr:SGNH/GDSL hydrolase family protein [Verrucomicrobiae bacterium]